MPSGNARVAMTPTPAQNHEPRQRDRMPAPFDELKLGFVRKSHDVAQMLSFADVRRERRSSNMVRDTKTAVNTFDNRPIGQRRGEAANRAGAELKQKRRRNQRGNVGIENRQEDSVKAGCNRLLDAFGRQPTPP